MNQILDYNPNKSGKGSSSKSDKIVRFFAIILIVFALCLLGTGAYGMVMRNKDKLAIMNKQETKATIEVETLGSEAIIRVTHDKAIEKLIYNWNDSKERQEKGSNIKTMEIIVPLPAGENTLHIKVIDINGVETTYDKLIVSENGIDIINPVIDISVTEDKKLKIKATDETELLFITYRWNNEQEVKVDVTSDNLKKIEVEIEILHGRNDITVVAVDSSNNTTTETKSFTGVTKPETAVTLSADGKSIIVSAKHENGIKEVKFNFNDVEYDVNLGDGTPKTMEFPIDLQPGYNRIILKVVSVDGTETEFDGYCTYEPEVTEQSEQQPEEEGQSLLPDEQGSEEV